MLAKVVILLMFTKDDVLTAVAYPKLFPCRGEGWGLGSGRIRKMFCGGVNDHSLPKVI